MIRGLLLKSFLESWVTTVLLACALMGIEAILAYALPTFLQQFSPQLLQLEFFRSIIQALLGTDVGDMLSPDALHAIAELAATVNERTENIGARRLHTMMEKVLESLSFDAPERGGDKVVIDEAYVRETLSELVADQDLSKYIL